MISNLLHNAIKYTQPGGQIKISLKDQEENAFLTVEDTGIGIPEEHLPLIFNRLYRVDKSRSKEDGGGSGLGLSICKHIVEAHKGKIEVESQPGVGTKFKISFPKIHSTNPEKV
jgi:two-component system phosphate regulon sensor histidine kinase PhoR